MRHPIVIIGSGLAGYNVAKELRKLDREIPLMLVTGDGGQFYSKPTLSNALASNKTPAAIPINTAEQMAVQLDATIRTRTRVTALDVAARQIRIGEETISYSKLVMALGADQVRLPLAGNAAAAVMTVNGLDDYARFRAALEGRRRIAIIGAGLIGCEFSNDLAGAGYSVHTIDIAAQPLPRLLPVAGAALLQQKFAALGIHWHLGTSVKSIDHDGDALRIALANGEAIAADLVLSAIGLKPKLDLAQAAGLKTRRGIVVDRYLATSAEDVYALGDCAEVEGLVLPFVMPIMHAARALAPTLAGRRSAVAYPAMPVLVKTPSCPTIVAPPANGAIGEWLIERGEDSVKSLFIDSGGKLLGFALNGAATAERAKLARELPPVLA
ncbi:MAG TPA: FAD-dependent oxidoreductase [Burkholderiales bacterium]|nr:FAD-dependent oxidoreductase [Burkholderiales bacterium]